VVLQKGEQEPERIPTADDGLWTESSLLAEVLRKKGLYMRGNRLTIHGASLPIGRRFRSGVQPYSGAPEPM
jgi:hypothetical protein